MMMRSSEHRRAVCGLAVIFVKYFMKQSIHRTDRVSPPGAGTMHGYDDETKLSELQYSTIVNKAEGRITQLESISTAVLERIDRLNRGRKGNSQESHRQ